MHIVHIETGRHLYGGARQVVMLLNGLAGRGVRCSLVCPPDSSIATAVGNANVEVHTIPMAGELDARFGRQLGRYLEAARPDILHVHSRRGAEVWGGLAAKRGAVPAVLTRRVDNPETPVIGRIKYSLFERVIAISKQVRTQLVSDGVAATKIDLVYSAVEVNACQPAWSREQFLRAFGYDSTNLVVVCVAQLIARKGQRYLLDAWPTVVAKHPTARLLLFGQGPLEAELQTQASNSSVSETIRFAGFRDDLRDFLGRADMLVHPALSEGLGVILLEAQAAGLPIVACRAGGIEEAVAENSSALLAQPADAGSLATALIQLLNNSELRADFGEAGRAHVGQYFAVEEMVAGNLAVYEDLVG
jgi:glycosyltransferase involved in cell wall biosynthesis